MPKAWIFFCAWATRAGSVSRPWTTKPSLARSAAVNVPSPQPAWTINPPLTAVAAKICLARSLAPPRSAAPAAGTGIALSRAMARQVIPTEGLKVVRTIRIKSFLLDLLDGTV